MTRLRKGPGRHTRVEQSDRRDARGTREATVNITDNDGANGPNPIFHTPFFVRQHYLDFLSREPDTAGFNAWVDVLNTCSDVNNNPTCDRIAGSSSFFGSQEFQLKGYFVYRFYKLAFNRLPSYSEIVVDMRAVTGETANEVFQKKTAFANTFVQRTEFTNQYNGLTNSQYVSILMGRYGLTQITTPDPARLMRTNKVTLTTADLTNQLTRRNLDACASVASDRGFRSGVQSGVQPGICGDAVLRLFAPHT